MPNKRAKVKKPFISIKDATIPFVEFVEAYSTDSKARRYLENVRWHGKAICPHCGCAHVWSAKRDGVRGYYECPKCGKVFTVRTGTIFERSHVPLRKWLYACYKVITSRKGISSIQLALEIGVTQKTAWFMLQRLRMSCAQTMDVNSMLKNIVEADASYFGGKEKNKHASKKLRMGREAVGKVVVLGAKERGGRVGAKVIDGTDAKVVHGTLSGMVSSDATLMTDEHKSYDGVPFANHEIVKHALKEFVKGMASTNEIESVWSILKRGWNGIYHHFSPKHLQLYVNEFCFRLNEGKCDIKLEDRITSLCGFGLKRKHMTYRDVLNREGDNGLMRAA